MIKLNGILGNNCGTTIDVSSLDKRTKEYSRYKQQGYAVTGGISTLRGFAKVSDLANASTIDKGYQRSRNQQHIKDIRIFLDEGRILSRL